MWIYYANSISWRTNRFNFGIAYRYLIKGCTEYYGRIISSNFNSVLRKNYWMFIRKSSGLEEKENLKNMKKIIYEDDTLIIPCKMGSVTSILILTETTHTTALLHYKLFNITRKWLQIDKILLSYGKRYLKIQKYAIVFFFINRIE